MPSENVPLVITQGEDYTAQIVWTDEYGSAQPVKAPMRMDIKANGVSPVLSLTTPDVAPTDGSIAPITYSSDIGLIQLHVPRSQTETLQPGVYSYDMFVTVNDGGTYAGDQVVRLLVGQVIVNKRITVM